MGKDIHYRSLACDLLRVIGSGAILASVLIAPNLATALRPFLRKENAKDRREWNRQQTQKALKRLRERRYVRFVQKGNETFLAITEQGRQRLRKFDFDSLSLSAKPRRWDRKWWVVAFDIPEAKQRERKIFRDRLDTLGFLPLQKSVFVYPHPCADEVDFLCQFLDVDRYVCTIEANTLGNAEGKARRYFGLL